MITISIADTLSPFVRELVRNEPAFVSSAMKSLGWTFRKETQQGITKGSPGGKPFAPRHGDLRFRRALNPKAPRAWYGRLRSAIAYKYASNVLDIGWVTSSAAFIADLQEQGDVKLVTATMRRKFKEAGYPIGGDRKTIDVDERPVFEPTLVAFLPKIAPFMKEKAERFLSQTASRARRDYTRYKI